MAAPGRALLCIEGLKVMLGGVPIIEDVSLSLARGETVGLVGESGSGKSLTALAVMGLLPPGARVEGRMEFDGLSLTRLDEPALCRLRGARIAMVFQEPMTALNPVRTIGAQIAEGLRVHGRGAEAPAAVRRLLDRVGLPAPRFSPGLYPHQLSGGQRQRVVIAIALACGPDLLIADEPTTALDATTQAQILDLLTGISAERGMALLLVSHDLGVIARAAGRTLVMYAGRVIESGPSAAVRAWRAHPYTHGLFAASPHAALPTPGARLAAIPGQVPEPRHRPAGCRFADRCVRVRDDCREAPPKLLPVGDSHAVACLHPMAPA